MNKNYLYLTRNSTYEDICVMIQHVGSKPKSIPVVESENMKVLLFSVQAQSLRKYLFTNYNRISYTMNMDVRDQLNRYFYNLSAVSQFVSCLEKPLLTISLQKIKDMHGQKNEELFRVR